jgi:CheY-like chemotaxis protein
VAPAPGRGASILLVEDEPDLWELTNRILARNGCHVYAVAAAADALRYASDLRQPIDLLLTDVIMPEMLGNEVAARVRAVRPTLAVLFMSGYAERVLDNQALSTPMWARWRSRSRKRCCSAAYARPLTAAGWTALPPGLTDFAGGGARRPGTLGARVAAMADGRDRYGSPQQGGVRHLCATRPAHHDALEVACGCLRP